MDGLDRGNRCGWGRLSVRPDKPRRHPHNEIGLRPFRRCAVLCKMMLRVCPKITINDTLFKKLVKSRAMPCGDPFV